MKKKPEEHHKDFLAYLNRRAPLVYGRYTAAVASLHKLAPFEEKELLLACAPLLEDYLAQTFECKDKIENIRRIHSIQKIITVVKRNFIHRNVLKSNRHVPCAHEAEQALAFFKPLYEVCPNLWNESTWLNALNPWECFDTQFAYIVHMCKEARSVSCNDAASSAHTSQTVTLKDILEKGHTKHTPNVEQCTRAKDDMHLRHAAKILHTPLDTVLQQAAVYVLWAMRTAEGRYAHAGSTLFTQPSAYDFQQLVTVPNEQVTSRDGFSLRDTGLSSVQSISEANYCLHCHQNARDTCSTGMPDKKACAQNAQIGNVSSAPHFNAFTGTSQEHTQRGSLLPMDRTDLYIAPPHSSSFKENPLGVSLKGCPLDQKISEMNLLKSDGYLLGALAVAMVDNPLLAATGHRICNDCMKACIFQKQDPVNVPGIETEVLESVLALTRGVDMYLLLAIWNPLNLRRPYPKPLSGKNVLVVGAGPAGFSISYHLLQEGHTVTLVDGGVIRSKHAPWPYVDAPAPAWKDMCVDLDARIPDAFGGVMEYGITSRWNKNYLTLIRLILERRPHFTLLGGVRFGDALDYHAAKALGFDHIALCMGAGKPKLSRMDGSMMPGVMYASDFLMRLQLAGAFHEKGAMPLDVQLPAVVIGGGLTSMDTATEILAYYPRYVFKMMQQWHAKSPEEQKRLMNYMPNLLRVMNTLEVHHKRFERARLHAKRHQVPVDFAPIFKDIGGVTLLYRGRLQASPAYRLNHEEVQHALNAGVRVIEHGHLEAIHGSDQGRVHAITYQDDQGTLHKINCGTLIFAMGTQLNTDVLKSLLAPSTSDVTVLGDMNPHFAGSVVKAMASARHAYPVISRQLGTIHTSAQSQNHMLSLLHNKKEYQAHLRPCGTLAEADVVSTPAHLRSCDASARTDVVSTPAHLRPCDASAGADTVSRSSSNATHMDEKSAPMMPTQGLPRDEGRPLPQEDVAMASPSFLQHIRTEMTPTLVSVNTPAPGMLRLDVRAPFAARHTRPGQFFKVMPQTPFLHTNAKKDLLSPLQKDIIPAPLVLSAYEVQNDVISFIALDAKAAQDFKSLPKGAPLFVMGPNGAPTQDFGAKRALLIGGGLGNVILKEVAKAFKERGIHVTYLAGFRTSDAIFDAHALKRAATQTVFSVEHPSKKDEEEARYYFGTLLSCFHAYASNDKSLGYENMTPLKDVDLIYIIGPNGMLKAFGRAFESLKDRMHPNVKIIAAVNMPMQCMLQGVCATCLQWVRDDSTEALRPVFTCQHQDHALKDLDLDKIEGRLHAHVVSKACAG